MSEQNSPTDSLPTPLRVPYRPGGSSRPNFPRVRAASEGHKCGVVAGSFVHLKNTHRFVKGPKRSLSFIHFDCLFNRIYIYM